MSVIALFSITIAGGTIILKCEIGCDAKHKETARNAARKRSTRFKRRFYGGIGRYQNFLTFYHNI